MKTLVYLIVSLLLSINILSQTIEKPANKFHSKNIFKKSPVLQRGYSGKLFPGNSFNTEFNKLNFPGLSQMVSLPFYAYEAVPVSLSDSVLAFAWCGPDSLYFVVSNDTGKSWSEPVSVIENENINSLCGLVTAAGRVILTWLNGLEINMAYSDNLSNWHIYNIIQSSRPDYLNLSKTDNGTLWLCYSKYISLNEKNDIYCITSTNNGSSWNYEKSLFAGPGNQKYGTVISGPDSGLINYYCDDVSGNYDIYQRTSVDGGSVWSAPKVIINSEFDELHPSVVKQTDGTIWLFYSLNKERLIPGYFRYDINYTKSSNGTKWETPVQFTKYAGTDFQPRSTQLYNSPLVSFISERDGSIWYGIPGITQDSNPPPVLLDSKFKCNYNADSSSSNLYISAWVEDETGIGSVMTNYFVNDDYYELTDLYDDGMHEDKNAQDNIWGKHLGNFRLGDLVAGRFSILDISGIESNTEYFLNIPAIHDAGDIILSLQGNSGLGEAGIWHGTSACWPKNGNDYLFLGGLWVGLNYSGNDVVINRDYYEYDWQQDQNSNINIAPGYSDQDVDIFFKGSYSGEDADLYVHQKSYQWSGQAYNDFIIIEYTIKNDGSHFLDSVYASLWLDPDISEQTITTDDLGGYDMQRSMPYIYDSENNPGGYFGVRLLSDTVHTSNIYSPYLLNELSEDQDRYNFMTAGITSPGIEPSDYRVLLTPKSFSLAPNDSHKVFFGIVLGNGLAELQANSDSMLSKYNYLINMLTGTGSESEIPAVFKLHQNYPNPFNPTTTFNYDLPQKSKVTLTIYNILGEEVIELIDAEQNSGKYYLNWNASNFSSGVYIYCLKAGNYFSAKKLIVMK